MWLRNEINLLIWDLCWELLIFIINIIITLIGLTIIGFCLMSLYFIIINRINPQKYDRKII